MYLKNAQLQKIRFVHFVKLVVMASTSLTHVVGLVLMIRFARLVIRVNRVPTCLHLALGLRMPFVHVVKFVVRDVTYLPHAAAPRIPYAFKCRKMEAE